MDLPEVPWEFQVIPAVPRLQASGRLFLVAAGWPILTRNHGECAALALGPGVPGGDAAARAAEAIASASSAEAHDGLTIDG